MMMKLMKVLVVALVAGSVCAPVASQAGDLDGKAVMCEKYRFDDFLARYETEEERAYYKKHGGYLILFVFDADKVSQFTLMSMEDSKAGVEPKLQHHDRGRYSMLAGNIQWGEGTLKGEWDLDRKTLKLGWYDLEHGRVIRRWQCQLVNGSPNELFKPYLDLQWELYKEMHKGNIL